MYEFELTSSLVKYNVEGANNLVEILGNGNRLVFIIFF